MTEMTEYGQELLFTFLLDLALIAALVGWAVHFCFTGFTQYPWPEWAKLGRKLPAMPGEEG